MHSKKSETSSLFSKESVTNNERSKKKPAAKSPTKKSEKKEPALSIESYVIHQQKPKTTVQAHQLNPLYRKRGIVEKMKKDVDVATLSAQAKASIFKDDLAERIPRAEVAEHMKFIATFIPTMTPAGSFRRGNATCNDIDIVICEPIGLAIARLSSSGYIKHTFSAGAHKFSGIVKLPTNNKHRHLDIVATNPVSYPFTMLYFTGSRRHNIILRLRARRMGLRLNEWGLFKDNADVAIPDIASERDIFTALGVEYKEPNERV